MYSCVWDYSSTDDGGGSRVAAGYSTSYGGDSVNKNSTGMVFMTIKGS